MNESTIWIEAIIKGYHVYEDIWTAVVDEELDHQWAQFCMLAFPFP